MRHQPATTAPPDCGSCGADDELIPCTDPGGSVLLCRLCVIALIGSTEASVAVLLDVLPAAKGNGHGCHRCSCRACQSGNCGGCTAPGGPHFAQAEPWERGGDRTDASGPDLPDWPEEKEN